MYTYTLDNLVSKLLCFKSDNSTLPDVILMTKPKRFTMVLICACLLTDFHNIICVSTKLNLPRVNNRHILYGYRKYFDEFNFNLDLLHNSQSDLSKHWCKFLSRNLSGGVTWQIYKHATVKSRTIRCQQAVHTNSEWHMKEICCKIPKASIQKQKHFESLEIKE